MRSFPRRFCLRKAILLFAAITLIFAQLPAAVPTAYALSLEEEKELGTKFMAEIRRQFEFLEDDFADAYINELGQYLVQPLETRPFPFHFYIIKDSNLNAFAAPAGNIFVFTGLIESLERIDELAAVICHEIGHVTARHLSDRIEQNKKIGLATMAGMLAGLLIGGKAGGAVMSGTMAAGIQTQLKYSREDERQADQLGFVYMDKAGYDPSAMIDALKRIQQGQWFGTEKVPPYLLTHPTGPERMSYIDSLLSRYRGRSSGKESDRFGRQYAYLKTLVKAKCYEPFEAERMFRSALEKDPASVQAHFGMGLVQMERADYDQAVTHLMRALRTEPESLPILRNLGEAYQLKGQYGKAIEILERALRLDDQDRATIALLAASYQGKEDYSEAVRLYERLASTEPVKDDVFYNLGMAYGRDNRLPLAHYNFGIYWSRLGRKDKARFHLEKAAELAGSDSYLKDRIQKEMSKLK